MESTIEQQRRADRDEYEEYLARERSGATSPAEDFEGQVLRLDKEIAAALDSGVVLDGRLFRRTVKFTVEHDVQWQLALEDAGLLKSGLNFDPLREDQDDHTRRLILNGFASGALFRYMACALTEESAATGKPVPWSPSIMHANADWFKQLDDLDDQKRFYTATSYAILDFFLNAGGSWRTFLKYLSRAATNRPIQMNETSERDPAVTTTSATGSSPSAASLDSPDDHP